MHGLCPTCGRCNCCGKKTPPYTQPNALPYTNPYPIQTPRQWPQAGTSTPQPNTIRTHNYC